jgi:hypothetical protein
MCEHGIVYKWFDQSAPSGQESDGTLFFLVSESIRVIQILLMLCKSFEVGRPKDY